MSSSEILIVKFRHRDCQGVAQTEGELPALQYEIYGVAFSAGHVHAERTSVDDVDLLSRQISDRDHFSSFANVEGHVLAVVHQFVFLRVVPH